MTVGRINPDSFGAALLGASLLRPLILPAAAWLLLRLLRIRKPASQHTIWSAVALGMLLLPALNAWMPHWNLPVLPARPIVPAQQAPALVARTAVGASLSEPTIVLTPAGRAGTAVRKTGVGTLLLAVYLAGFLALLAYRALGWILLRRLVSRARQVHGRVRESSDAVAPVTAGTFRPILILPAGWSEWDRKTRRAVLAHEFAHIRRGDGLAALLSRTLTSIFWYHPMAWLVARRISDSAEAACDAAALERGNDPAGYARILLAFANQVRVAGFRVDLPGLAMAAPSGIGRRIDRVFELSQGDLRGLRRPGTLAAVLGAPLLCLAATAALGERVTLKPAAPPPPAAPVHSPKPVLSEVAQTQAPAPRGGTVSEAPLPSLSESLGRMPGAPGLYLDQDMEEYHGRQAYGDDHFSFSLATGSRKIPGSASARGQAYVRLGLADSVEDHAATPETAAYQLWRYRHAEDLGENVTLEFVDGAGTGEYYSLGSSGGYAIPGEFGRTEIHLNLRPGAGGLHVNAAVTRLADAPIMVFDENTAPGAMVRMVTLVPGRYTLTLEVRDEITAVSSRSEQQFQVR